MPSELGNQAARSTGGAAPGAHFDTEAISQLIVVTFADSAQAEGLYEALVALDKQKLANLEDTVFVTKNEAGDYEIDEKVHHEKRTGMAKGAVLGVLVGWMLGGPVLGLAGGAIVGRLIGKRMDLGIDAGTIKSIAADLDEGQTAVFILGSAQHRLPVIEAFKQYNGKIVQATVDESVQQKLQQALDEGAEG